MSRAIVHRAPAAKKVDEKACDETTAAASAP
jgi:hypothetical protein